MYKSLEYSYEKDYYTKLTEVSFVLTTFDNFKVKLCLCRSNLIEKVNLALSLIPKSYAYYNSKMLVIEINPENVRDTLIRYVQLT